MKLPLKPEHRAQVERALAEIFRRISESRIESVKLPLLGTTYGMVPRRFSEILKSVLRATPPKRPLKVWLAAMSRIDPAVFDPLRELGPELVLDGLRVH